jgi:hypothetical protein
MKNFELINKKELKKAEREHKIYLEKNPDKVLVCDDMITPFFNAMKGLGYSSKLNQSGSKILRKCVNEECKQLHSSLYVKNDVEYWACPNCQRIG